ncbi:MAG: DUF3160 domain-containing protein [Planctomycetes bacterium]|nr:DUF3160 domain-containing protein [Planctomycetota bacterium]
MNCDQIKNLIEMYAINELPPADTDQIRAHLKRCPSCNALYIETKYAVLVVSANLNKGKKSREIISALTHEKQDRIDRKQSLLESFFNLEGPKHVRLFAAIPVFVLFLAVIIYITFGHGGQSAADPDSNIIKGVDIFSVRDAKWNKKGDYEVELSEGELFVKVDPSLGIPFVVSTSAGTAIVKGTEFFIGCNTNGGVDMNISKAVSVVVLSGLVQLSNSYGSVEITQGESGSASQESAPKKHVENLAIQFAKYYKPSKVDVKPSIPQYKLPLDRNKIVNFDTVTQTLGISDASDLDLLLKNGFLVIPGTTGNDDIIKPYEDLREMNVPIFITIDSLLHLYHVQFDQTLKDIEEREFYKDIKALTNELISHIAKMELPEKELAVAQNKVLTYLTIGAKLLDPDAKIPASVKQSDVDLILGKIQKHEGFWPNPPEVSYKEWPLFKYSEDFSQYKPRGHYTRTKILSRYFKAMMWYGRMTFILKGGEPFGPAGQPFLVSSQESHHQILSSAILVKAINDLKLSDGKTAGEVWKRIYQITSFYVGLSDDLGVQEYLAAIKKICGAAFDLTVLSENQSCFNLKVELAKYSPPAIYSGTGLQGSANSNKDEKELVMALDKSTGFRLMGQRFIPDSYIMGRLITPVVRYYKGDKSRLPFTAVEGELGTIRGFSRGLDIMAVLGSKRASELIHELGDDNFGEVSDGSDTRYETAFMKMKQEFSSFKEGDWNRNLYWSWLYVLKSLLNGYSDGYQTFMTTKEWENKTLNTAIASWSQLRHDTILYAKQVYTLQDKGESARATGYVEPAIEFYSRLHALTQMTNRGLSDMDVLDDAAKKRLDEFEGLIVRLLEITNKELKNVKLSEQESEFIAYIGDFLKKLAVAPNSEKLKSLNAKREKAVKKEDWDTVYRINDEIEGETSGSMKTTLIADVLTEVNSNKVLEVGTGQVNLVVVCYLQPDGNLFLAAGPVLSYYEFKHPLEDRLTDEKWRSMLKNGKASREPEWTRGYTAERTKYTCGGH